MAGGARLETVARRKLTGGFLEGKKGKLLKAVPLSESTVQSAICDLLEVRNVVYSVTDARMVETEDGLRQCVKSEGWPDITAMLPITGRLWAIEVKSESGKLREAQVDMLALIEASGGLVTVARDTDEIREILDSHRARYETSVLSSYFDIIKRLKRAYTEHRFARRQKARQRRAAKERSSQLTLETDLTGSV